MSKKGKNTQAAPEAENTQAAPEAKMTRSVVPQKYRAQYGKAASCGDALAAMMKGADIVEVAQANGIDLDRWAGKNPGMIRMNLGNVLRGRVKRNEPVFIAGKQIN